MIEWCNNNQIAANPSKFQAIFSDPHNKHNITIENNKITSESYVKLLGVTIDTNLNFNMHISILVRRASQQLNSFARVSRYFNPKLKLILYKSFVMCHFNYCPVVWSSCNESSINKLEKVQYRALKHIYKDFNSSYDVLLIKSGLPSLKLSRLRQVAIATYKAVNTMSPTYINTLIDIRENTYNLRNNSRAEICHKRTSNHGLKSFRHIGSVLWNDLPNNIKSSSSLQIFKSSINKWAGPKCKCGACKQL